MSLFYANDSPGHETWSVAELTSYIRELFEIDYRLQDILVEGEISNFVQARSGHLYFTLKDEQAQLKCVMWRSAADRLHFLPQDGDAVVAGGRISVYEASGVYQLYVESLKPAGRGGLAVAFEEMKERLAAEGLFDQDYKQPVPPLPSKIGIVTSADAAALRDILNVLRRRWPLVEVLVAPTLVQGRDAPPQIVNALTWLDGRNDIDTIIVARGGGSMEDLWAFNDERVARAIFAARHPIISGVGHETDFTIADFVADVRAPTPSAAAELAVPDRAELRAYVGGLRSNLTTRIRTLLSQYQQRIQSLKRTLGHVSPRNQLDSNRQHLDMLIGRLDKALNRSLEMMANRLALTETRLQAISPLATLARGYAIVRQEDGRIVRRAAGVTAGEKLRVQLADGEIAVTAEPREEE